MIYKSLWECFMLNNLKCYYFFFASVLYEIFYQKCNSIYRGAALTCFAIIYDLFTLNLLT